MSFLADAVSSDPEDHHPITRLLEDHRTEKGGYQVWSIGCICGFYDKGQPGRYIPSEAAALRIHRAHLTRCGIETTVADADAERRERFREGNDKIWGEGNWIECERCPDSEGNPSFHHRKAHD